MESTIKSIIDQKYPNLEYIIIDGGSSDGSVEIIKRYKDKLAYWISEQDAGLYHALEKGFTKSTGEIMGYLNSDDMLHSKSLYSLSGIFQHKEVEWVQGAHSWFDEQGRIYQVEKVRLRSKYNYLRKDYHHGFSPFIQQESTYWRRTLWERSGGCISTDYKLAGDFELWMRFFKNGELYITNSLIGGFRRTGVGQLSVDNAALYLEETEHVIDKYKLTKKEMDNLNFLAGKSLIDKLPYFRRKRFKRRNALLKEMKEINWNPDKGIFIVK